MHNSIQDYHITPTYAELIQEAVIHPTATIKYPNIIATPLRNTPQLTRFNDESCLDMSTVSSNAVSKLYNRLQFKEQYNQPTVQFQRG